MIRLGDCLDVIKTIESNSIDCIVTDPPYGLSFMGRDWDKVLPPVETWREVLRVLKPGSIGCIMCSPRQDLLSHMLIRLEEAGFDTNFSSIYWTYASGFPKAHNIGKVVDKQQGGIAIGATGVKQRSADIPITAPASEDAKRLDGSYAGFQPKPAIDRKSVV